MFLGSTRDGRMGARVANFMRKHMEEKGMKVDLLDPLELDIPLLRLPFHWYSDPSAAPEPLQTCDTAIKNADAVVVVSAEYNSMPPPALINLLDHFDPKSYSYKPSGIVTYSPGSLGGARASIPLRAFLTELGCLPVREVMGVSSVHDALDEEGVPKKDDVITKANKLIAELEWMASAMRNHKDKVPPPSL